MARSTPSTRSPSLRRRLATHNWRRVGMLAAVSFVLSASLILYLFGFGDRFVARLAGAFFVGFCLLSVTFLAVLPFISWATTHWFGKSWQGGPTPAPARRASQPTRQAAGPRRSPILP